MKQVLFDCVLCDGQFTEVDIANFIFFPSTRICYKCYRKMQKTATAISCFGKQFDIMAEECRSLCPDRKLCPGFSSGKFVRLRKLAESTVVVAKPQPIIRQYPFRSSSLLCKAFKLCMKGVTLSTLKRWCKHRNKKHSWVLLILRKEISKNGKKWKLHESKNSIELEYPLSR